MAAAEWIQTAQTAELVLLRRELTKYSDDQPRDEAGRWTSDGGGAAWSTSGPFGPPGEGWDDDVYYGDYPTAREAYLHGFLSSDVPFFNSSRQAANWMRTNVGLKPKATVSFPSGANPGQLRHTAYELRELGRDFPESMAQLGKITTKVDDEVVWGYLMGSPAMTAPDGSVLHLNPDYFMNPKMLDEASKTSVEIGWWPQEAAANPWKYTLDHEFGHVIMGTDPEAADLARTLWKRIVVGHGLEAAAEVSGKYAVQNEKEYFATEVARALNSLDYGSPAGPSEVGAFLQRLSERQQAATANKYDDSQPRDDTGRWTSDGSSPAAAAAAAVETPEFAAALHAWVGDKDYDGMIPNRVLDSHDNIRRALSDPAAPAGWRATGETLLRAAADSEPTTARLYRGINVDAKTYADFAELKPGDETRMNLSSWSSDGKAATNYAIGERGPFDEPLTGKPVLFTLMPGARALDVQGRTPLEWENEYLASGRFRVVSRSENDVGLSVGLRQVEPYRSADQTVGLKAVLPAIRKYDENEPRDDRGRWVAGGYEQHDVVLVREGQHAGQIGDIVSTVDEHGKPDRKGGHYIVALRQRAYGHQHAGLFRHDELEPGDEVTRQALRDRYRLIQKYSEDQPRDDQGRWASDGGAPMWSSAEHTVPTEAEVRQSFDRWSDIGAGGIRAALAGKGAYSHGRYGDYERDRRDGVVLANAIANVADNAPVLWRGLRGRTGDVATDPALLAEFQPGKTVDLNLSSWSSDQEEGYGFASANGMVLRLEAGAQAFSTERWYPEPFASEREWLTDGRFRVVSVGELDMGGGDTPLPLVTLRQEAVFAAPDLEGTKAAKPKPLPWATARFSPILERHMDHRMVVRKYSEDQPRDDHGRWTADGSAVADSIVAGRPVAIRGRDLPHVLDAFRDVPDNTVSISDLRIDGRAVFHSELGLKRGEMPQLPTTVRSIFLADLQHHGVSVTQETVDPLSLKPVQSEISGRASGFMLRSLRVEGVQRPPLVSSDNYIIDGHHTWAGAVGFAMERPGWEVPITRIGLTRDEALKEAYSFANRYGVPAHSIAQGRYALPVAKLSNGELLRLRAQLQKYSEDQPRDERGRWAAAVDAWAVQDQVGEMRASLQRGHPSPDARTLMRALGEHAERVEAPLYRVIRVPEQTYRDFSKMRAGDPLQMNLASWTDERSFAEHFATPLGPDDERQVVRFVTEPGAQALNLGRLSPEYGDTHDYVSAGRFHVRDIRHTEGALQITLHQTELYTEPAEVRGLKILKYSEDQARDERGRWTADGGGAPMWSDASPGVRLQALAKKLPAEIRPHESLFAPAANGRYLDHAKVQTTVEALSAVHAAVPIPMPITLKTERLGGTTVAETRSLGYARDRIVADDVVLDSNMYRFPGPVEMLRPGFNAVPTLEGAIVHEYGHVFQDWAVSHVGKDVPGQPFQEWRQSVDLGMVSGYAFSTGDPDEAFGEAFAAAYARDSRQSESRYALLVRRYVDSLNLKQADKLAALSEDDLLQLRALLAKYSEDQPRDESGRWTSDGAGSSIDPASAEATTALREWTGRLYDDDINQPYVVDLHAQIRDALAGTGKDRVYVPGMGFRDDAALRATGEHLLAAVNGSPPTTIPLYRGMRVDDETLARFEAMRPGEELPMNLSSWTDDRDSARRFAMDASESGKYEPHPVVLMVDPGARALDVAGRTPGRTAWEREFLTDGVFRLVDTVEVAPFPNSPYQPARDMRILTLLLRQTSTFSTAAETHGTKGVLPDLRKYSEDQPRDDHGRWSDTGGDALATLHPATELITNAEAARSLYARTANLSEEEYAQRVEQRLNAVVPKAEVRIRLPLDVTEDLLAEALYHPGEGGDRIKSQFETGDSGGYLDPEFRSDAEKHLFGYAEDLDPEKRPIYGYLGDGPVQEELTRQLAEGTTPDREMLHYGDVVITLKDDVRERTTFVVGDSLARGEVPRPVAHPAWDAAVELGLNEAPDPKSVFDLSSQYTEAEIHGGVSVRDIKSITFLPSAVRQLGVGGHELEGIDPVRAANKLGIPITVVPAA